MPLRLGMMQIPQLRCHPCSKPIDSRSCLDLVTVRVLVLTLFMERQVWSDSFDNEADGQHSPSARFDVEQEYQPVDPEVEGEEQMAIAHRVASHDVSPGLPSTERYRKLSPLGYVAIGAAAVFKRNQLRRVLHRGPRRPAHDRSD